MHPIRSSPPSVNLSIKNVPAPLAEKLRRRAARAHRSLQGELLAILEEALGGEEPLTPTEVLAIVRRMKLKTPAEAARLLRAERDARQGG